MVGTATVNSNTFTNEGTLDLETDSGNPNVGKLSIYDRAGGNTAAFVQSSGARVNLRYAGSAISMSLLDIRGSGNFAGSAYVYLASSVAPPMFYQELWMINGDTLTGSVTWDFSNAILPSGSWVTGTNSSDGRDHWYIKRIP